MQGHLYPKKTENTDTIPQTTCGEGSQEWSCVPDKMSTLPGVLCWGHNPTSRNSIQGAHSEEGGCQQASITVWIWRIRE